jgi:hypothetical protein
VPVIEVVNCGGAHPVGGADSKHGHPGEEEEAGVYDVGLFGVWGLGLAHQKRQAFMMLDCLGFKDLGFRV